MSDPRHWTPEQLFVLHWLYPDFTAELNMTPTREPTLKQWKRRALI